MLGTVEVQIARGDRHSNSRTLSHHSGDLVHRAIELTILGHYFYARDPVQITQVRRGRFCHHELPALPGLYSKGDMVLPAVPGKIHYFSPSFCTKDSQTNVDNEFVSEGGRVTRHLR